MIHKATLPGSAKAVEQYLRLRVPYNTSAPDLPAYPKNRRRVHQPFPGVWSETMTSVLPAKAAKTATICPHHTGPKPTQTCRKIHECPYHGATEPTGLPKLKFGAQSFDTGELPFQAQVSHQPSGPNEEEVSHKKSKTNICNFSRSVQACKDRNQFDQRANTTTPGRHVNAE